MTDRRQEIAQPTRRADPAFADPRPMIVARWLLPFYLLLALLLGGGGVGFPFLSAAIQMLGLLLIVARCFVAAPGPPPSLLVLLFALLALPLAQLVPLPLEWWGDLPGRAEALASLQAAGIPPAARPISLDPSATLRTAFALIPGLALLWWLPALASSERRRLVQVFVAIALVSAVLGALQRASGGGFILFPTDHAASAPGLLINRNHQASFLQVAILLAAALPAFYRADEDRRRWRLIATVTIALLAAGSLATTSRMGFLTLPATLAVALLLLVPFRRSWRFWAASALVGAASLALLSQIPAVGIVVDRFSGLEDIRWALWADSWAGILHFWPIGSGLGTFPSLFAAFESLDSVDRAVTYNAHNDFLEFIFEGGAYAALLLASFFVWLLFAAARLARSGPSPAGKAAIAALAAILLLGAHSLTDYPLRMTTLATTFGLLCALAWPRIGSTAPRFNRPGKVVAGLVVVVAALPLTAIAASNLLRAGPFAAPEREQALAGDALEKGQLPAALDHSIEAVRLSPLDPRGLSLAALAQAGLGREAEAAQLLERAAGLGWRDPVAQAWMLDSALAAGDASVAILRADALLRTGTGSFERLHALLRRLAADPAGRAQLAERLAADPPWRGAHLQQLIALSPPAFASHGALLRQLASARVPPRAEEIAVFLDRLVEHRRYAEARALSQELGSGGRSDALLNDPLFTQVAASGSAGPFRWARRSVGGVTIQKGEDGLMIQAQGSAAGPLLSQMILLRPGRYRLVSGISEVAPRSVEAVYWEIICMTGRGARAGPATRQAGSQGTRSTFIQQLQIPAGCPAQRLELRIASTGSSTVDLRLHRLELQPLATGSATIR